MNDAELIEACCGIEEGLTDWEVDFVDEMGALLKRQRAGGRAIGFETFLSVKRRAKLLQIWGEKGDS